MVSFIARVLSYVSGDVKVQPGGGANVTIDHMGPPGDDSPPLSTDKALCVPIDGTGTAAAGGYFDTVNEGVSLDGEVRRYARDASGAIVCSFHLKRDGSVRIANSAGFMELDAGGTWTINGLTITPGGNVITANGTSLDDHPHEPGTYAAGGDPVTGVSGDPIPG